MEDDGVAQEVCQGITRRRGECQPYARDVKGIPVPCRKDALGADLLRVRLREL